MWRVAILSESGPCKLTLRAQRSTNLARRVHLQAPALFTFKSAAGAAGDQKVRVVEIDGNPWFVAADVCRCLGLDVSRGSHNALRPLAADEKRMITTQTSRLTPNLSFVSESGLYKLTLRARRSTHPTAARFQDWVTREVLPAIRPAACAASKDGGYIMGEEKVLTGESGPTAAPRSPLRPIRCP